jgi:hypothetical protein
VQKAVPGKTHAATAVASKGVGSAALDQGGPMKLRFMNHPAAPPVSIFNRHRSEFAMLLVRTW